MSTSRRTWCRMCGVQLKLPRWKAWIGLHAAVCNDEAACEARLLAARVASVAAGRERTRRHSVSRLAALVPQRGRSPGPY